MLLKVIIIVVLLIAVAGYTSGYRISCCQNGWLTIDGPVRLIQVSEEERNQIPECYGLRQLEGEMSFSSESELENYLVSNDLCAKATIRYLKKNR